MKLFSSYFLTSFAQEQYQGVPKSMQISDTKGGRTPFGASYTEEVINGERIKEIVFSGHPLFSTQQERYEFIKEATEAHVEAEKQIKAGTFATCTSRDSGHTSEAMDWFPALLGTLTPDSPQFTSYQGHCFGELDLQASFTPSPENFDTITISMNASYQGLLCAEYLFFGALDHYHQETYEKEGKHTLVFKNFSEAAKIDIRRSGLKTFLWCQGVIGYAISSFKTLLMFTGGSSTDPNKPYFGSHVPEYMAEANIEFLRRTMGGKEVMGLEKRKKNWLEIDPTTINSGDFFVVTRLDGLDPLIGYGTGSHSGHSVMALRFDGELYLVESQAGWYWPKKNIQRTKWADWIQLAKNASYNIVHVPLSDWALSRFDEKKSNEFFWKTQGHIYGHHNFIWGWLDTVKDNFPPLLNHKLFLVLMQMQEHTDPNANYVSYTSGLNKRLGTEGLKISDIIELQDKKNQTIEDLYLLPQIEGWVYHGDGPADGVNYVCSSYVAGHYEAAGLFEGFGEQSATEWSPKEIYQVNFFNTTRTYTDGCAEDDSGLPVCQFMGDYKLTLPNLSSIDPYPKMNYNCPSKSPEYVRPDGC